MCAGLQCSPAARSVRSRHLAAVRRHVPFRALRLPYDAVELLADRGAVDRAARFRASSPIPGPFVGDRRAVPIQPAALRHDDGGCLVTIAVVGAGVVGLTSAVVLVERGHRVRLVAAELPRQTTSATAGAIWGPYRAGPAEAVGRWADISLRVFTELADRPDTGVRIGHGMEVVARPAEPPWWQPRLAGWRRCRADELPDGAVTGWRYPVPMIDMPVYLDYLTRRLEVSGVEVTQRRVGSLDSEELADVVVNCTGLGARELAGDSTVAPVRGDHVVVANPGLTDFFMEDVGSSADLVGVYPHGGHVVLGGTAVPDSADRTIDLAVAQRIIERCSRFFPALATATVLDHRVGVRPVRPIVRIETERLPSGRWCVHNYGHGGAGVSLSWGCARQVADYLSVEHGGLDRDPVDLP